MFWIGLRMAEDTRRAYDAIKVIAIFSTLLAGYGFYALMSGNNVLLGDLEISMARPAVQSVTSWRTFLVDLGNMRLVFWFALRP